MTPARRWIAAVLAVGAVAALVAAFVGESSPSGAAPPAASATPVWSARRVPQPIVDGVGAQHLQTKLAQELPGGGTCFMVEDDGAFIAGQNVDTPLIPASAEKLFVAAAILDTLGPDFVYETKVLAQAAPANGTVDQLFLAGSGDPVLATGDFVEFLETQPRRKGGVITSFEALADAIVAAGVRRVPGGVVGDDSRYDGERLVEGWKTSYLTDGDVGPLGALTVNDGYRSFTPRRPADDPALNAATRLTDLLVERGVQVGVPSHAATPGDAVEVAKIASPPLHAIVASMLTTSDALTAELFAKELGVRASNQGTTGAGTAAIVASVQKLGVPVDGLQLFDASGLHRDNRTTCRSLMGALALGSRPGFTTLWDGLSVVAEKGTLINQLLGLGLDGKLRGKTGTLAGVSSLVGKIDGDQQLRFAIIDNSETQYGETIAEGIRAEATEALTTFPEAPDADTLVPAPA